MKKPKETWEEREARFAKIRQEKHDIVIAALKAGHKEGCTSTQWSRKLVLHFNMGRSEPHTSVFAYTCSGCAAKVTV